MVRVRPYLFLTAAIIFEVAGTLLLPKTNHFKDIKYVAGVGVLYALSFVMLTFVLDNIQLSIAYTTWAGMGVAMVSLFGHLLYGDRITVTTMVGMVVVIVGIVLVNMVHMQPPSPTVPASAPAIDGASVPTSV